MNDRLEIATRLAVAMIGNGKAMLDELPAIIDASMGVASAMVDRDARYTPPSPEVEISGREWTKAEIDGLVRALEGGHDR